jgi:hypothetical protein
LIDRENKENSTRNMEIQKGKKKHENQERTTHAARDRQKSVWMEIFRFDWGILQ